MRQQAAEFFAARLRGLLDREGVSIAQLAKALDMSRPSLSRLLSGKEDVTLGRAEKIAGYFRKQLGDMLMDNIHIRNSVAYLTYIGWDREAIQAALDLDRETLDDLLGQARRDGTLRMELGLSNTEIEAVIAVMAEPSPARGQPSTEEIQGLLQRLGRLERDDPPSIQEVHVFDSGWGYKDEPPRNAVFWRERQERFARAAAPMIALRIVRAERVGCGNGTTIFHLLEAVRRLLEYRRAGASSRIRCMPTVGELIFATQHDSDLQGLDIGIRRIATSSSAIARLLEEALNGEPMATYSLQLVPSFIPTEVRESELDTIKHFYEKTVTDYHHLLRKKRGAEVEKLDTLITSVSSGVAGTAIQMFGTELRRGGITRENVAKVAVGDIGQAIIPRDNPERLSSGELSHEQIERRCTGITLEQYHRCARRHVVLGMSEKPLGVCVAAISLNKAKVIVECVRRSLVNTLVIDRDAFGAIAAEVGDR